MICNLQRPFRLSRRERCELSCEDAMFTKPIVQIRKLKIRMLHQLAQSDTVLNGKIGTFHHSESLACLLNVGNLRILFCTLFLLLFLSLPNVFHHHGF